MFESCVSMYNLLLVRLKVSIDLKSSEEINPELLIAIYRAVTNDSDPPVVPDEEWEGHRECLGYIVTSLQDIIGSNLDHITSKALMEKDNESLYNLAEILLGVLDISEDEQSLMEKHNTESCDTEELMKIESANTLVLQETPHEFALEESDLPLSPIPDISSNDGPRSRFPEVVNSSFSGSEIVSVDVPIKQVDSSRSHKTDSSKPSLMRKIETRIKESKQCTLLRPQMVSQNNLTANDVEWTETSKDTRSFSPKVVHQRDSTANTLEKFENAINDIQQDDGNDGDNERSLLADSSKPQPHLRTDRCPSPVQSAPVPEAKYTSLSSSLAISDNGELAPKAYESNQSIDKNDSDSIVQILNSLKNTVDKSKKVRNDFEQQKKIYELSRTDSEETANLCLSTDVDDLYPGKSLKNRSSNKKERPEKTFQREVLDREEALERLKQQLYAGDLEAQLHDMELKEKEKIRQLKSEVSPSVEHYTPCPVPSGKAVTRVSKNRAKQVTQPSRTKIVSRPQLNIGPGDMLKGWVKTIMDELPVSLDQATIKRLCDKQEQQAILLHKEQHRYDQRLQTKNNKISSLKQRQALLNDIHSKEEAAEKRIHVIKENRERENQFRHEVQLKRQNNARIKRYFDQYQTGLKKTLVTHRHKEERMLKEIFNEGLSIQKERIRELRKYAKEMRAKEDEARQKELDAIETHYNNQFEILADEMREQKKDIKTSQKDSKRQLEKVKKTLRNQLEGEIQELHEAIVRENESTFYRDIEEDRIKKQIRMANFHQKVKRTSKS